LLWNLLPSGPYSLHTHPLCYIHNELDVGVIVVVRSAWHFYVTVCHPDIVRICCQILWCGHDSKLDSALVTKGLVGPPPHGADFFDRCDTIVGNEDL